MDIRQLKNVLAVMETGSLNKASLQLRVSQPALTKSIQRLEALLGVPLFVREATGMRATIYAETLRDFARATCVGLDQSISEIHAIKSGLSGTISMCGPPLIARHLFPAAIIRVTTDFPNLKIRIVEQIDDLFEALLDGKFDLLAATITSQASRYGLNCLSMFDEDLVVIARRGHPVTRMKSPTPKQLSKYRWVHSSPGNLHRQRLEQFFEMANVPFPRPIAETSSPALIRSVCIKLRLSCANGKNGRPARSGRRRFGLYKDQFPIDGALDWTVMAVHPSALGRGEAHDQYPQIAMPGTGSQAPTD